MDNQICDKPLVSIVMPVYNASKFIEESVRSILEQSYPFLEFIMVDDASNDGTLDYIKRIKDDRIVILENEKNMGIAYSTNRAIERSKGKYIALMDDDDVSLKDRISIQVSFLEEHPEIDLLGGNSELIDENGTHIGCRVPPRHNPKYIKAWLLFRNVDFSNATAMIRRDFLEKNHLMYQEGCFGMQDYRFYVDGSKIGNISAVDDILIKNRRHAENETKKQMKKNGKNRACLYAQIQRDSLQKSGYQLTDEQYTAIHRTITEERPSFENINDYHDLHNVFSVIMRQAEEMHADYIIELDFVLRRLISDCVYNSKLF